MMGPWELASSWAGVNHGGWLAGQPRSFLPWRDLHLGRVGAAPEPKKNRNKELSKGPDNLNKGKEKKLPVKGGVLTPPASAER